MSHDPILDDFAARLRRCPDLPVAVSGTRRATTADVDRSARAVTERIASAGVSADALVGLAAPNGPGFAAGFLGLRRAGCAVLLLDHRMPAAERESVAAAIGASGILTGAVAWPESSDHLGFRPLKGDGRTISPPVATVRLTSGSTGAPRGIAHTSEALAMDDDDLTETMALERDERILASVPVSHAYGFVSVLLPALRRESVMVVPEDDGPFAALTAAVDGDITFLPTVPAYLQAVLRMQRPPALPPRLRLVITAGAPLPAATAAAFRRTYGRGVHVFYGASEVGGITFDRTGEAAERGTLGTPVEGVSIELAPVDGAPEGMGAVTVRSPAAAVGYVPGGGDRLNHGVFRTSDLGRFVGGELELVGRLDDMINVRGKKVNPREVEGVLAELEGVEEVVVVGVDDPSGAGEMVAAVLAVADPGIRYGDVHHFCAPRLAGYKVPRAVAVVEAIPRTSRGKIDRRAVLALADSARAGSVER